MAYYKTGTISVTANSTAVVGSGTKWVDNVRVGDGLRLPNGQLHEITARASDTELTIYPAYTGDTASGKSYMVVPVLGYQRQIYDDVASLLKTVETGSSGGGSSGDSADADSAAESATLAAQSAESAADSAEAAAGSASSASMSATAAASAETEAADSATDAASSASSASSAATSASESASTASSAATLAGQYASTSTTSAANSADAAERAESAAERAEAAAAGGGGTDDSESVDAAAKSAEAAAASATAASDSANAAAASATEANDAKTEAAGSATAAATSETNATNAASTASSAASEAAVSASAAAISETNAQTAQAAAEQAAQEAKAAAESASSDDDYVPVARKVTAGTGLTGGGPLHDDVTLSLSEITLRNYTADVTYGSGTVIPTFKLDKYGRIISVTLASSTPNFSSINNKPSTVSGYGISDAVVKNDFEYSGDASGYSKTYGGVIEQRVRVALSAVSYIERLDVVWPTAFTTQVDSVVGSIILPDDTDESDYYFAAIKINKLTLTGCRIHIAELQQMDMTGLSVCLKAVGK